MRYDIFAFRFFTYTLQLVRCGEICLLGVLVDIDARNRREFDFARA